MGFGRRRIDPPAILRPDLKERQMDAHQRDIARKCIEGSETGTMTFPQIVGTLIEAGFEGYLADLRRGMVTYYLPNGESVEFPGLRPAASVAAAFDARVVKEAIREAQQLVPGYTYKGFCAKVAQAGCVGYQVSFPGRRVVYFGRTAETHTEHFPNAK
jgi:uncharacterized protein YbcV (DUF1398 family)